MADEKWVPPDIKKYFENLNSHSKMPVAAVYQEALPFDEAREEEFHGICSAIVAEIYAEVEEDEGVEPLWLWPFTRIGAFKLLGNARIRAIHGTVGELVEEWE